MDHPKILEKLLNKSNMQDLTFLKDLRSKSLHLEHYQNASILWKKIRKIHLQQEEPLKKRARIT